MIQYDAALQANPAAPPPRGTLCSLEACVRALSTSEQGRMVERVGVRIDPAMRIDAALQLARAIINLPEARDSELLRSDARAVLRAVASAGGSVVVNELPPAVHELTERGMLFAQRVETGTQLSLPTALLLQVRPWENEDPCSVRVLLWHTGEETKLAIASYYLGRPATRPLSLSLEQAFAALTDPAQIADQLQRLSPTERRVLHQIEEQGGEVDTAELLDLEREPLRLRTGSGQTLARRGVSYSLERRGFLIPLHPNRHVIPREVAAQVGAGRHDERAAQRRAILQLVLGEDHAPRRARFAKSPAPLSFAVALLRAGDPELHESSVVPRSVLSRWAMRLGQDAERVALIAALSRAAGLWDVGAKQAGALRDCSGEQVTGLLFDAWYRGGAWSEAHPGGEVARVGRGDAGALYPLRRLVLEALLELGQGRWVPWEALAGYVRTDARAPGLTRLLNRWATRVGVDALPIAEVARRMTVESLHALGIVDLGMVDSALTDLAMADSTLSDLGGADLGGADFARSDEEELESELGATLRVTPRGLALLTQVVGNGASDGATTAPSRESATAHGSTPRSALFDDTLRIGDEVRLSQVLALASFAELQAVTPALELRLTSASVGEALAQGVETAQMLDALTQVTQVPDETVSMLRRAGTVRGAIEHLACSGFLRIEQAELRDLLLSRRQTMDLFLPSSPPGGLLIAPAMDFEQVVRRCRIVGVELTSDGQVCRMGSTRPPPARSGAAPASGSKPGRSRRPVSGKRGRR